jgi:tRNA 5-methylaminomethyl-2-thiouridine biosynthesis bifunctional protein
LTAASAVDGRFYASAWRFALDAFEEASGRSAFHRERCGLLQLARDTADAERLAAIAASGVLPGDLVSYVSAAEASAIAGCPVRNAALYFPQGGWLAPRELCAALSSQSELLLGVDVAAIRHAGGSWQIIDSAGGVRAEADAVVLANALGATVLPQAAWLPVEARRGQISLVPATEGSATLRSVLVFGGYITPAVRGAHTVGATFQVVGTNASNDPADVRAEDHADNLASLAAVLPGMFAGVAPASLHGRSGVRCTSPDHLPLVGALPDRDAYLRDFAALHHGHPWTRYPDADYQAGLFALVGLGSRGLVAAPLAAELLACHLTGEPWPLERDLVTALHPGRFLVRELKRREA